MENSFYFMEERKKVENDRRYLNEFIDERYTKVRGLCCVVDGSTAWIQDGVALRSSASVDNAITVLFDRVSGRRCCQLEGSKSWYRVSVRGDLGTNEGHLERTGEKLDTSDTDLKGR